jgi:hypothetical protein
LHHVFSPTKGIGEQAVVDAGVQRRGRRANGVSGGSRAQTAIKTGVISVMVSQPSGQGSAHLLGLGASAGLAGRSIQLFKY